MKRSLAIQVIWDDETILVVNKPSGLPSLPDGYHPERPHLLSLLTPEFGQLWIVHRLDQDTSGVIVLARSASAHRSLNSQFEKRSVAKTYHALVRGTPPWTTYTIRLPLLVDGDREHRSVVNAQDGKPSITDLRLLESFGSLALIEAVPHTGRTHQVRAHLAALGFPVAVDALYGDGRSILLSALKPDYKPERSGERPILARLGLHARLLELNHPNTDDRLIFEGPYPKDFAATLNQLRKIYPQNPI